jgi:hypothetical protein
METQRKLRAESGRFSSTASDHLEETACIREIQGSKKFPGQLSDHSPVKSSDNLLVGGRCLYDIIPSRGSCFFSWCHCAIA